MIKGIIWDFGGVIVGELDTPNNAKSLSTYLGVPHKKFYKIYKEKVVEWEYGKMSEKDFFDYMEHEIKLLNPNAPGEIRELLEDFLMKVHPLNPEMLHIATSFTKYKLGLLSNCNIFLSKYYTKFYEFDKLFKYLFFSCDYKLVKPDPKFYKKILSKMRLKPKECLFIDNMQVNVNAAKTLGLKTILFKNKKQLLAALKR